MLAGFGCIFFGYKLFVIALTKSDTGGHFKIPGLGEVKLKAAPGVFFALLGAIIIYATVTHPIQVETKRDGSKKMYMSPPP